MPTNLQPYNDKGQAHGLWEMYFSNGQLDYKGEYINGLRHGLNESYCKDGSIWYKGTLDMGKRIGLWNYNGRKVFYAN